MTEFQSLQFSQCPLFAVNSTILSPHTQPLVTSTLALAHSDHNTPLQQLLAEDTSSIPKTSPEFQGWMALRSELSTNSGCANTPYKVHCISRPKRTKSPLPQLNIEHLCLIPDLLFTPSISSHIKMWIHLMPRWSSTNPPPTTDNPHSPLAFFDFCSMPCAHAPHLKAKHEWFN